MTNRTVKKLIYYSTAMLDLAKKKRFGLYLASKILRSAKVFGMGDSIEGSEHTCFQRFVGSSDSTRRRKWCLSTVGGLANGVMVG